MRIRVGQAIICALVMLGTALFLFGVPYLLVSITSDRHISFSHFLMVTTMARSIGEFVKMVFTLTLMGAVTGLFIPRGYWN